MYFVPVPFRNEIPDFDSSVEHGVFFLQGAYPLSETGLSYGKSQISYISSALPLVGPDLDILNLWLMGELATDGKSDRTVGIVSSSYFSGHLRPIDLIGLSLPSVPGSVLVDEQAWTTLAHELGHTYGLYVAGPEQRIICPPWSCPVNGFWVARNKTMTASSKGLPICFMGSGSVYTFDDNWISDGVYSNLFRTFRTSSDDPDVLLVNGIIYSNGTVIFGPLYEIRNSTTNEQELIPGNYSIELIGQNGNLLHSANFSVSFAPSDPNPSSPHAAVFGFAIAYLENTTSPVSRITTEHVAPSMSLKAFCTLQLIPYPTPRS